MLVFIEPISLASLYMLWFNFQTVKTVNTIPVIISEMFIVLGRKLITCTINILQAITVTSFVVNYVFFLCLNHTSDWSEHNTHSRHIFRCSQFM